MNISIIIPCFNQLAFTKQTVESIVTNSHNHSYHLIMIDNGSTDGTREYLDSLANTTVVHNLRNTYVNPAWNQGFQIAMDRPSNPFVCLLNNDVIVGKDWLDHIDRAFQTRQNEYYVPGGNYTNLQGNPQAPFVTQEQFNAFSASERNFDVQFPAHNQLEGYCLFFRLEHVSLFHPIPKTLRIWFGDYYMFNVLHRKHGIHMMMVRSCPVYHLHSKTLHSTPEAHQQFLEVIEEDKKAWKKMMAENNRKLLFP